MAKPRQKLAHLGGQASIIKVMGFRKTAVSGVGWIGGLRIATRLVTLIKIAVLARLLTPHEFGRFGAAAMALTFFETLTETGVNQALIHSDRKIEAIIDSAWMISIVRGILISILIFMSAGPLSRFFRDSSVVGLVMLIALVPAIKGFINPMTVVFFKELKFSKEFIFRSILLVIDGAIALTAGYILRSATAFVVALLVSGTAEVVLSFLWFKVRPKFKFQMEHLKEILGYGKWVTLSGIAFWLSNEMDDLFTGRIFGTAVLGIYQNAFKISTLPVTEIAGTVNQVAFPMLSKVKHDEKRFSKIFKMSFGFSSAMGLGLVLILLIFPDLTVRILLGEQWLAAVPIIRLLAIYGLIRTVESGLQPMFMASGRPKIASFGNIIKAIVMFGGLLMFADKGLDWIAGVVVISGAAVIPYYFWQMKR